LSVSITAYTLALTYIVELQRSLAGINNISRSFVCMHTIRLYITIPFVCIAYNVYASYVGGIHAPYGACIHIKRTYLRVAGYMYSLFQDCWIGRAATRFHRFALKHSWWILALYEDQLDHSPLSIRLRLHRLQKNSIENLYLFYFKKQFTEIYS